MERRLALPTLRAAVHEEIERLPERYRVPIVLCDLEGRTHEQAARHLGCPVGTVKSRLARGRVRLGERLTRRGVIVPTGILVGGWLARTTRAAPSASWTDSTTRAAMRIAADRPLAGAVSPAVLSVMKGVSRGFVMNSLKGAALVAVTLGALAAGAGGLAWAGLRGPTGDPQDPPRSQASRPDAGEEGPRDRGPGPETRGIADLRGQWEVIYLAGTVAGKREGYPMPKDRNDGQPNTETDPRQPSSTPLNRPSIGFMSMATTLVV